MATCHSLGEFQGQLLGSAVETSMFAATSWVLNGPDEVVLPFDNTRLFVSRRLAFDPTRRTMSVVVTADQSASRANPVLYLKGAPEAVIALCSSVPASTKAEVTRLSADGCYVLALGSFAKKRRLE